jgi:muramoyltetrapeptide carboxypeptidase
MIRPPSLKPGDTVGIIAPARKIREEELTWFYSVLSRWGLKWKNGSNLFGNHHQYSGTDEERAADLQNALDDPEIKAIICARGGYGTIRTLQGADFSSFEKKPKWLAGFSDITVLHAYINKFLNIESLHSPMPLNITEECDPESLESLRKALFGETLHYRFDPHPLNSTGMASGEMAGGNLSLLYSLNGTGFFPDTRNKILFLEDVDEYLYHIDRMMQNLVLSGAIHRVKAVVCGGFTKMRDNDVPFGKTAEEIIAESIKPFNIPLCLNFPAGHQFRNLTLIFGRDVQLRVEDDLCHLQFQP